MQYEIKKAIQIKRVGFSENALGEVRKFFATPLKLINQ